MTVQDVIDELSRFDPHTECRIDGMEIDCVRQTQSGKWGSNTRTIINIVHNRRENFPRKNDISVEDLCS